MTALFDEGRLLRQCAGDSALAAAIIDSYWLDAKTVLSDLSRAASESDRHKLQHAAHTLAGLAAYICSDALHNAAVGLESAAMNSDMTDLQSAVDHIKIIQDNLGHTLPRAAE